MSQEFEATFKSLSGLWNLKREISTGERLVGKADFEFISKSAFLLREEGDLTLANGVTIAASRNWYWHLSESQILEITYDKTRDQDYHLIHINRDWKSWFGEAKHLCGADLYSGEYRFYENGFEIKQAIKGPNKDYTVVSRYSK